MSGRGGERPGGEPDRPRVTELDPVPRRSLEVAPEAVGGRPARAAGAAAAVVLVAVVTGLLRPWGGDAPPPSAAPSGSAAALASAATPTPSPWDTDNGLPNRGPVASPASTPWPARILAADVRAAATARSEWGLRAIVVPAGSEPAGDGSGAGLVERWAPVDPLAAGGRLIASASAVVGPGDAVVAIGVTTGADLALDVRAWRFGEFEAPRRLVPEMIAAPEPGGVLLLPDPGTMTGLRTWPAGSYRVDLLFPDRIERVTVLVPTEAPGDPGTAVPLRVPRDLADPLGAVADGPFAVVAGGVQEVRAATSGGLDERAAWAASLDEVAGLPAVGRVVGVAVAGIGVVLPPGELVVGGELERLAPALRGARYTVLRTIEGIRPVPGSGAGPRAAVLLGTDGPGALGTGLYRVVVRSRQADGAAVTRSYHVEVVPRPAAGGPVTPLLAEATWRAGGPDAADALPGVAVLAAAGLGAAGAGCGPASSAPVVPLGTRLLVVVLAGVADAARASWVGSGAGALVTLGGEGRLLVVALDPAARTGELDLVASRQGLAPEGGVLCVR